MAIIRTRGAHPRSTTPPVARVTPRTALLACGLLSSLVYIAADIIGGLSYDGYSFASQAISELGAIGAPSAPIMLPLLIAYNVLMLAFGLAVLRERGRGRALTISAAALATYAAIGLSTLAFPTYFRMQQRGVGNLSTDAPHIILTGLLVALLLTAIGSGAFAFGRRFRVYSLVTLAVVIGTSALTVPFATRLAAGEPTTGLGILERIDVYASVLWPGVLAIALLRQSASGSARMPRVTLSTAINGFVAPAFEDVRVEFARNFAERGEIGAAVAAYWHGEKIVDLWGGFRTPERTTPWNEDTMIVVMSTTKGLAAMTLAIAESRGWLDYDAPVSRYWPEFAQNGKDAITIRQLLSHEAGLVLLDERLTVDRFHDLDDVARVLARQTPAWKPGTRHGYHAMTIGLYMQEIIRRVDPAHRTLGAFFHDEIAVPLGLDFYIGLPPEIPDERVATFKPLSPLRAILALPSTPPVLIRKILTPGSLLRRSLAFPTDADFNQRKTLEIELPAGNGVGTARAIARAYSAFAERGTELGITPATFARITAPPSVERPRDEVIGIPSYFSLGFLRPGPDAAFGSSARAFGTPGAGGSFGFADPDAHLGYAYVMNKLDFWLIDDPREKALRDAIYRSIGRLRAIPNDRGQILHASVRHSHG